MAAAKLWSQVEAKWNVDAATPTFGSYAERISHNPELRVTHIPFSTLIFDGKSMQIKRCPVKFLSNQPGDRMTAAGGCIFSFLAGRISPLWNHGFESWSMATASLYIVLPRAPGWTKILRLKTRSPSRSQPHGGIELMNKKMNSKLWHAHSVEKLLQQYGWVATSFNHSCRQKTRQKIQMDAHIWNRQKRNTVPMCSKSCSAFLRMFS